LNQNYINQFNNTSVEFVPGQEVVYDYTTKSLVNKGELDGTGSHDQYSIVRRSTVEEKDIYARKEQISYQPVPPQDFDLVVGF
jgi:hypothetical protein